MNQQSFQPWLFLAVYVVAGQPLPIDWPERPLLFEVPPIPLPTDCLARSIMPRLWEVDSFLYQYETGSTLQFDLHNRADNLTLDCISSQVADGGQLIRGTCATTQTDDAMSTFSFHANKHEITVNQSWSCSDNGLEKSYVSTAAIHRSIISVLRPRSDFQIGFSSSGLGALL